MLSDSIRAHKFREFASKEQGPEAEEQAPAFKVIEQVDAHNQGEELLFVSPETETVVLEQASTQWAKWIEQLTNYPKEQVERLKRSVKPGGFVEDFDKAEKDITNMVGNICDLSISFFKQIIVPDISMIATNASNFEKVLRQVLRLLQKHGTSDQLGSGCELDRVRAIEHSTVVCNKLAKLSELAKSQVAESKEHGVDPTGKTPKSVDKQSLKQTFKNKFNVLFKELGQLIEEQNTRFKTAFIVYGLSTNAKTIPPKALLAQFVHFEERLWSSVWSTIKTKFGETLSLSATNPEDALSGQPSKGTATGSLHPDALPAEAKHPLEPLVACHTVQQLHQTIEELRVALRQCNQLRNSHTYHHVASFPRKKSPFQASRCRVDELIQETFGPPSLDAHAQYNNKLHPSREQKIGDRISPTNLAKFHDQCFDYFSNPENLLEIEGSAAHIQTPSHIQAAMQHSNTRLDAQSKNSSNICLPQNNPQQQIARAAAFARWFSFKVASN